MLETPIRSTATLPVDNDPPAPHTYLTVDHPCAIRGYGACELDGHLWHFRSTLD